MNPVSPYSEDAPPPPTADGLVERRRVPSEETAAVLAHEIRGPLTVALGYLGILGRLTDEEARAHAIAAATRAVVRADAIIEDVLTSLGPAPLGDVPCEPMSVSSLAARVVADLPTTETSVAVLAEGECAALANELRLTRALTNVLGNALKFSPEGGEVTVSVVTRHERVLLSVEDEGPGIPANDRERVFVRFERLPRDADTPGSGLGLALARDAVAAFGGRVRAMPRGEGAGACVVIDLPAAPRL
jgi:signal transduction histidine kinase